jgi:hypothetical protein
MLDFCNKISGLPAACDQNHNHLEFFRYTAQRGEVFRRGADARAAASPGRARTKGEEYFFE